LIEGALMQPDLPYRNRSDAGRLLAEDLAHYKSEADVVVLGLTRGGVPVAAEVANALHAPLDVVVVRKLGVPFQPELAMGAIAGDDTEVLDKQLVRALDLTDNDVEAAITRERAELQRRERLYRGGRPALDLKQHTAILVDDGLATGSTMLAAVAFARKRQAKGIVMAVPVASVEALEKLRAKVDECICLATPEPFFSVGDWYWNFLPTEDAEVLRLLEESAKRTTTAVSV
jgi:putative phosphoribosyl transferase